MIPNQVPRNVPTTQQLKQVGDRIQSKSAGYFLLWGAPELGSSVAIQFSNRLRTSLGRTRVDARRIRLHALLAHADEQLLDEVLCHELAHVVVYERFGRSAKPHGPEWAALMRQAGFEPRLRISIGSEMSPISEGRFEHRCPVCQAVRYARRSMSNLRCKSCVDAGLDGKLLIRNVGKK